MKRIGGAFIKVGEYISSERSTRPSEENESKPKGKVKHKNPLRVNQAAAAIVAEATQPIPIPGPGRGLFGREVPDSSYHKTPKSKRKYYLERMHQKQPVNPGNTSPPPTPGKDTLKRSGSKAKGKERQHSANVNVNPVVGSPPNWTIQQNRESVARNKDGTPVTIPQHVRDWKPSPLVVGPGGETQAQRAARLDRERIFGLKSPPRPGRVPGETEAQRASRLDRERIFGIKSPPLGNTPPGRIPGESESQRASRLDRERIFGIKSPAPPPASPRRPEKTTQKPPQKQPHQDKPLPLNVANLKAAQGRKYIPSRPKAPVSELNRGLGDNTRTYLEGMVPDSDYHKKKEVLPPKIKKEHVIKSDLNRQGFDPTRTYVEGMIPDPDYVPPEKRMN